jgi:hypothetical protein
MRRSPLVAVVLFSICMGGCGTERTAMAPAAPAMDDDNNAAAAAVHPRVAGAAGAVETPSVPVVAVNTRDPIDGAAVDPSIPPIIAVVDSIRPAITVAIGVSSVENGKRVEAEPLKYAPAAMHNTIARKDTDTNPGGY